MQTKESFYNISIFDGDAEFIYNTAYGSFVELDSESSKRFHSESMSSDESECLKAEGIIVDKQLDEYHFIYEKMLSATYGQLMPSQKYIIVPTFDCNANCKYCFEKDRPQGGSMTEEVWNLFLTFFRQRLISHPETRTIYVSFFGGEPTLELDMVVRMSSILRDECNEKSIKYFGRIITNGILLSENAIIALSAAGINKIQITIDGLATTWAEQKRLPVTLYSRVINNIAVASEHMKVIVRINIDNSSKEQICSLLDFLLLENGLKGKILIVPEIIREWNDSSGVDYLNPGEYFTYLNKYRKHALKQGYAASFDSWIPTPKVTSCGLVRNSCITVDNSGNFYRCEHVIRNEEMAVGNLRKGYFHNEVDFLFKEEYHNNRCRECKYYPLCHGGCRMENIVYGRRVNCKHFKRQVNARLKYYIARLRGKETF